MEFLSESSLDNLVLIALMKFRFMLEMDLVVTFICRSFVGSLHVERDGLDARQGEVGILDILAVYLFVPVQQIGVLELLDRLVCDFGNPEVIPQAPVFKDHFLKVFKVIPFVIVSINVLKELSDVLFFIHDFRWGFHLDTFYHDFGD